MRYQAMIYNAVVQVVSLYRSESWLIMDETMKVLEGFHHIVARRILGKMDRSVGEEGWE